MKSYEIYRCRRQALGFSRDELAKKAGVEPESIELYELGIKVDYLIEDKIRNTLVKEFKELDSISHYKKRILELALEINEESWTKSMYQEIGHMIVELGKLQMEITENSRF